MLKLGVIEKRLLLLGEKGESLMATGTVVIGAQWGDEGKGKIVDVLAAGKADVVVRYQGGNNAGHTLVVGGKKTVLHLVPSGALHPGVQCVIGAGVVVDPIGLVGELVALNAAGVMTEGRILVSDRAQMVLPTHKRLDQVREELLCKRKIGTTGRGIGPAYEDVVRRSGIRCGELRNVLRFISRVREHVMLVNQFLRSQGFEGMEADAVIEQIIPSCEVMLPMVTDTRRLLQDAHERGEALLFEGAQGTMLDVVHGTYPFVTSSRLGIGGVLSGTGLSHKVIGHVVCVAKAYTTRVGSGPFPTELECEVGEDIRKRGAEFGATTGRPRRCGWLDLAVVKYACELNGADALNLTKLDILSGMGTLKVCVGYTLDGERVDDIPADADMYARVEPIYEEFEGWDEDISGCRTFESLPEGTKDYVWFIEQFIGVPVKYIGVGPGRNEMIIRS